MKKVLFLLAAVLIASTSVLAQSTTGYISYDIEMTSDDPDLQANLEMAIGSKLLCWFEDDRSRTTFNMGMMMTVTTTVGTDSTTILVESILGNQGVLASNDEIKASDEEQERQVEFTKENKSILGYKCKKAIVTNPDGSQVEYWWTKKFKMNTSGVINSDSLIPGVVLQFTIDEGGLYMNYTATTIEKDFDSSNLSLAIPDDYAVMTYAEFLNMGL